MLHMARHVEVEYRLFYDWYEFIMVLGKIFRRVCKILSTGIFFNPIWLQRLTHIIKMVITPQISGLETKCLALYPGILEIISKNPVIAYS